MATVLYSMSVSLDGYIAGPGGEIDWSAPDEELHRFHNERVRELGAIVCGRRLYEVMTYWDATGEDAFGSDVEREFAGIWKRLPKIVASRTLDAVGPNARLVRDGGEEVARLRAQPGPDVEVGGAGLASTLIAHDLVDEYRLFVCPVLLGGGTPLFPRRDGCLDLELLETRTFASRVVHARYRRVRPS